MLASHIVVGCKKQIRDAEDAATPLAQEHVFVAGIEPPAVHLEIRVVFQKETETIHSI